MSRKVLRQDVPVGDTEGVRETHTIWAPFGYRVVSAGFAQEEGSSDILSFLGSFPHYDEETGAQGWRFFYATDASLTLTFWVIVESIYCPDALETLK